MRNLAALLLFPLVVAGSVAPLLACLWDYDTLAMERSRFPDALELITGKFLRHSEEFYRWRIEDRKKRIEADPDDVRLHDDLAVAYDKVGEHELAIHTMQEVHTQNPDRYETLANLGTFYIHSGDFEKGAELIGRAIEINPDAHFGREVYQKLLVEYVIKQRAKSPNRLPLNDDIAGAGVDLKGFAMFVLAAFGEPQQPEQRGVRLSAAGRDGAEIDKAIKGVLGMMRFGHYDSPVLLEALGDLLLAKGYDGDAKRLAARAFLKASYETEGEVQQAYRLKAEFGLKMQTIGRGSTTEISLESLEGVFAKELNEANSWYAKVRGDELRWIAKGVDADAAFTQEYYEEPKLETGVKWPSPILPQERGRRSVAIFVLGAIPVVLLLVVSVKFAARRLTQTAPSGRDSQP